MPSDYKFNERAQDATNMAVAATIRARLFTPALDSRPFIKAYHEYCSTQQKAVSLGFPLVGEDTGLLTPARLITRTVRDETWEAEVFYRVKT